MSKRPEELAPAEVVYNAEEAVRYNKNSRIRDIQRKMAQRAIDLLNLPAGEVGMILDIGCGGGISGEVVSENGHYWVGMDISRHMLQQAVEEESDGDLLRVDMGEGLPFRAGVFDGVISISALQWIFSAESKEMNIRWRLQRFFEDLYKVVGRGRRAVLQFYPHSQEQVDMLTKTALKSGFSGGVVIDYPNSKKAKKYYLCLLNGKMVESQQNVGKQKNYREFSKKAYIAHKRERMRRQGKEVRRESKYTGRKRSKRFY